MTSAFIKDLAVVISVAAGTTLLCRVLRQPVVIGYLLAGVIIGPHTPPFKLVQDLHIKGIVPRIAARIFASGSYQGSFRGELEAFKALAEREWSGDRGLADRDVTTDAG